MRIHDAALRFNKTQAYDGYTSAPAFMCQPITIVAGTSANSKSKRAMNCAPNTVMPARRVVTLIGDTWIVGTRNVDDYLGTPIRDSYPLVASSGLMNLLTPAQACLSAVGTVLHASKDYLHYADNKLNDSEYDNIWAVLHASSEVVPKGRFLRDGANTLYRVIGSYLDQSGFATAQVYELDADALQPATFTRLGVYDPITDSLPAVSINTTVVQMALSRFYRFRVELDGGDKVGDRMVIAPASEITPNIGAEFIMAGETWRVVQLGADPVTIPGTIDSQTTLIDNLVSIDAIGAVSPEAWAMRVRLA